MIFKPKKQDGKRVILTFGTFDVLHAGHEHFFREAREHGDHIITIIARDETVKTVKGRAPVNNERLRTKSLRKTGWTDKVMLGNREHKHKVILQHQPDVIVLGYDQFVFTQTIEKTLIDAKMNTEIVRATPFFPQVYKSSLLREQKQNENQHQRLQHQHLT